MEAKMTECPKCKSTNIFVRSPMGVGWGAFLKVGVSKNSMESTGGWATYLCTDCGYFENYLTQEDWLTKIKTDPQHAGWRKSE